MNVVNSAYGDQVDITCAPLRTYESFAKSVLGLTEEQAPPSDHKLPDEGVFFWIKFTLGQKGKWCYKTKDAFKLLGPKRTFKIIRLGRSEVVNARMDNNGKGI